MKDHNRTLQNNARTDYHEQKARAPWPGGR